MRTGPRRALLALVLILAVLAGGLAWVAFSPAAARIGLERIATATGGRLALEGIAGSLVRGLDLRRITWADEAVRVRIDGANLRWDWRALLDARVAIASLRAEVVDVTLADDDRPASPGPLPMPGAFGLPVTVLVGDVGVGLIHVRLPGADEPLEFGGLAARAAHLPGEYRIEALRVRTPWGELRSDALRIGTAPPHALAGEFDLVAEIAPLGIAGLRPDVPPAAVAVSLAGNLERLRVDAHVRAGDARAQAVLDVAPLARALAEGHTRFEFTGIDPAGWLLDAPAAMLSGRGEITRAAPLRGRLELSNRAVGPLPGGAAPVAGVQAGFELDDAVLRIAPLAVRLAGDGRVDGEVTIARTRTMVVAGREMPEVTARLDLDRIDPAVWAGGLRPVRIGGEVVLDGRSLAARLGEQPDPAGAYLAGQPLAVDLRAELGERLVELARARLSQGGSALEASGTVSIEPLVLDLRGELRGIDPSQWLRPDAPALARLAQGELSARWQARGEPGHGTLALTLDLDGSRLAGATLGGTVAATLDEAMRLPRLAADLALGRNRVRAEGALGRVGDVLRWRLDLDEPELLEPHVAGRARASGDLGLADGRVWGSGRIEGSGLAYEAVRIQRLAASLRWPRKVEDGFEVRASASGLASADIVVDAMRVEAGGSLAGHDFSATGRAAGQRLALAGRGGWDPAAQRWTATLGSGRLDGTETILLEPGARISASPAAVILESWRLVASDRQGASAHVEQLAWHGGDPAQVTSRGSVAGLPLARVLAWVDRVRGRPAGQGDIDAALAGLRMDGQWQVDGGITPATAGVDLRLALGQDDAAATAASTGGTARVRLAAGALDGRLDLDVPSLVFLRRYLGEDWTVEGRLRVAANLGGTLDAPVLRGRLGGESLAIAQASQGWRLADGRLDARFDDRGLAIDHFRIASGEGELTMTGRAALLPDAQRDQGTAGRAPGVPLVGQFDVTASRFLAPLGPGQRLVVSGDTRLESDGRTLTLTGKVVADEGLIELLSAGPPALPDDIRIAGEAGDGPGAPAARKAPDSDGAQVAADVEIDLGRQIRIVGGGIDTRLEGLVRLRGALPAAPRIEGSVRVRKGTFEAYGQRLDIGSGVIRFNGPVDNPALDITAVRPYLPLEVGVRLSGTALSPRIALFSNPDVPDAEKLAWLVLGVPLADASSGAQALALQQAAATLLGGDGGTMSGSLNRQLGLDVLALGYASGSGQGEVIGGRLGGTGLPGSSDTQDSAALREVVTVGKRLASGVYLSYEQGLEGAWNLLRIQYDISRRLSLRLQTGSESAIDLLLQYWFD